MSSVSNSSFRSSVNLQTSSETDLGTATAALVPSSTSIQTFVGIKPTASASGANNNSTIPFRALKRLVGGLSISRCSRGKQLRLTDTQQYTYSSYARQEIT